MKQIIIDTHCHIYPEKIAAKAVEHVGDFYGLPLAFDGSPEMLLKEGQAAGIGRFIVSSVATTPHQVPAINQYLAGVAAVHPGIIYAMGALHPYSLDQMGDVERLLQLGLKGVKLHPDIQGIALDDPGYLEIFRLLSGILPVCCHLGDKRYDFSNPNRVVRILERFPDLCFIGAHLGGWSIWEDAYKVLSPYPNLMVDCSSALFALPPSAARDIVYAYGPERVLFGTDYPMWSPAGEVKRLHALGLSPQEEDLVYHKNAERIFRL